MGQWHISGPGRGSRCNGSALRIVPCRKCPTIIRWPRADDMQDESQVDMFDAVLIYKGYEDLVRQHRPVTEDALNDPVRRLGKPARSSVYAPFSFRQIAEFVILLPVNFVPYVGVPLFLLLTGYRAGPFQHWRYFQLLGYDRKQRDAFVSKKRWQYTW
jgi:hypothetical protein